MRAPFLDALCEHEGRTPGEIAAQLKVTTPTVVKMATRMSAAGLLTRRRDPADNRLVRLYLTDAGRALVRPVEDEISRIDAQLTADLTDAERATLLNALRKIIRSAEALAAGAVD